VVRSKSGVPVGRGSSPPALRQPTPVLTTTRPDLSPFILHSVESASRGYCDQSRELFIHTEVAEANALLERRWAEVQQTVRARHPAKNEAGVEKAGSVSTPARDQGMIWKTTPQPPPLGHLRLPPAWVVP
jgi:hypothetical protein